LAGVGTGMSIVFASLTYCNTAIINSVKAIFFCIISAWYAAGAGILTLYAISANENNVPAEEWRTAVWALLWGNLGLTVLMAAANDFIGKQKNIAIENNV
jgi:hypothetical protein